MKKIISLLSFVIIASVACSSPGEKKNEPAKPAIQEVKNPTGVTKLDKKKFLEEIVDYETSPQQWIYKGELPGFIDFYADWCRPCRITSPIIEELAIEYAGKINFFKVDIQVEQELAAVFGIQSIPSFLLIPKNETPVMSSGVSATPEATKAMFIQQINEILLKQK
jgi:thioredoxin 1